MFPTGAGKKLPFSNVSTDWQLRCWVKTCNGALNGSLLARALPAWGVNSGSPSGSSSIVEDRMILGLIIGKYNGYTGSGRACAPGYMPTPCG